MFEQNMYHNFVKLNKDFDEIIFQTDYTINLVVSALICDQTKHSLGSTILFYQQKEYIYKIVIYLL